MQVNINILWPKSCTKLNIIFFLDGTEEEKKSSTLKKKVEEEKKQREHLLELNQILAQQVMEKSKLVAGE